ncbi:Dabb family protein [Williamsia muralis]|uniref:Stress-response A/B barrel domain-containing protein n=1 Tax=Williamsia marianensis TaxID=85044 RepID=A0A2G3PM59_WILMA|nr:Dabb family protein [Williamsia marianensis]PHV66182.1 hypothetical protein CSW57_21435 [Williamsia marianensis]
MLRHVVLMNWNHELSVEEAAEVKRVLDDLGAQSPDVVAFSHGPDVGVRANGSDYALVADFDNADGWKAYSKHPAHDVVRGVMGKIVSDQAIVQFQIADSIAGSQ